MLSRRLSERGDGVRQRVSIDGMAIGDLPGLIAAAASAISFALRFMMVDLGDYDALVR